MAFQKVAIVDDVWSGELLPLVVAGKKVFLVNIEGAIYAYADRCAHLGVPLSEGRVRGSVLTCRAHHWEYDLCTGQGCNPATVRLQAFAVKIVAGDILVDVEQPLMVNTSARHKDAI